MHNIYDCVDSFASLLDTKYHFVLGRKGESVSFNVTFDKKDCFHLMGLQYLTDRPELSRDRGKIFDEIKARVLKKEQIESSDLYEQIADRIDLLPFLEDLFDNNDTVFKYNEKKNSFSMIKADYLMKNRLVDKNVFIFLSVFFRRLLRPSPFYFSKLFAETMGMLITGYTSGTEMILKPDA